jgi:lipoate-protein ligase A
MIKKNTKIKVYINYNSEAGYQLALDDILYNSLDYNSSFIKFVTFKEPSLMIGSNQSIKTLNINNIKKDNINVFRRLTRGTTILPNEYDLNYTIGINKNCINTNNYKQIEIFEYFSYLINNTLTKIGVPTIQTKWKKCPKFKNPSCFCVVDKGEIIVKDGGKIHGGVFITNKYKYLQQGQLLVGTIQDNIDSYLIDHSTDSCPPMCINMFNENITIKSIVTYLLNELSNTFNIEYVTIDKKIHNKALLLSKKYKVDI